MNIEDFNFDLPETLIAQTPLEHRSESRLLVIDKTKQTMTDKHFFDIIDELNSGDTLVLNNTRVLPARLHGQKADTGGHIELLLLKNTVDDTWEVLAKPAKKLKNGTKITFGDGRLTATVVDDSLDHGGRIVTFNYDGIFLEVLESLGEMPLPPYIHEKLADQGRYQTVYAKENGSAAAPTAGLHFTDDLLAQIKAKGVNIAWVTLHVGLGTFRPVSVDNIEEHDMHSEFYILPQRQKLLENVLLQSVQHLFGHWNLSQRNSMDKLKLIVTGQLSSSNQAISSKWLMPSLLTSTYRNQLWSC